eukprot:TRINITY_DN10370_c0_g1_i2.p1 TRINITY_DN10370_c0_g1~~TRINITY_DN10370_c0_g1_i2.p1  ORF type:complete len:252 (+),score=127.24 TRINITY_DN10370_c0_g1_i2:58-813(+)
MAEVTTESVQERLQQFEVVLGRLTEMTGNLGTQRDNPGLRKRIENDKKSLQDTRDSILADVNDLKRKVGREGEESKQRYQAMAKQSGLLIKQYERARKEADRKLKEPVGGAKKRVMDDAHEDDGGRDHVVNIGNDTDIVMAQLRPAYNMSALNTEEDIQREKADEIEEIAANMQELHNVYTEFQDEVDRQQEPINHIQSKVKSARENVVRGTSEVQEAGEYQKSSRKKMCCIGVMLLIIIIVIVVVVSVSS